MSRRLVICAAASVLLLSACSRDEEPAAAAPAPSAPPWSDATDAPVTPEPPPVVAPGAPAQPAPAAASQIPERFRGEWNAELADCGTGLNDSRLVLGPVDVAFYESSGEVTRVEQPASDELAVTAELYGEGEGPWTSTSRFRISPDGRTLTMLGEGAPLVRRRCPA